MSALGLEIENGFAVGKNPRDMSETELAALGHTKTRITKVIRQKCLDCCGNMPSEVRRCVSASCALWPYRMGRNPFYGSGAEDGGDDAAEAIGGGHG